MSICPKNKSSKGRRNRRRANWKMTAPTLVKCSKCGALMMPHRVCTVSYTHLDVYKRQALTDSELEEVMEEMYVDDTVDVLEEMPANVVDRLLMATDEETRQKINALLNYPEDSAGSIMNIDYISLNKEMTVADAILKIRQVGINKETIYTCYVTEKKKLIGVVDVKDILTSGESRKIEEIMDENVIYAKTLDDQEEVAETIRKYGLIAIPIIDHEMCICLLYTSRCV